MTHSLWFINHDWTRKRPIQVSSTHVDFWEFSKLEIKKSVLWRKLPRSHQNESSLWLIKYVSYALNHLQDSVICIFSLLQLYTLIFKIFDIFRIFENFRKMFGQSSFLVAQNKIWDLPIKQLFIKKMLFLNHVQIYMQKWSIKGWKLPIGLETSTVNFETETFCVRAIFFSFWTIQMRTMMNKMKSPLIILKIMNIINLHKRFIHANSVY